DGAATGHKAASARRRFHRTAAIHAAAARRQPPCREGMAAFRPAHRSSDGVTLPMLFAEGYEPCALSGIERMYVDHLLRRLQIMPVIIREVRRRPCLVVAEMKRQM